MNNVTNDKGTKQVTTTAALKDLWKRTFKYAEKETDQIYYKPK